MPAQRRRVLPRWMQATRTIRVGGVIRQWPPPPLTAPHRPRPVSRTWRSWAVLGSFVVLLASITFVASSESAPDPAHVTGTGSSTHLGVTAGESSPERRPGSATGGGSTENDGSADGSAEGIPLGVYAGEADPFGVATFGLQTGTLPAFATDYLDKSDGWAGLDAATNIKAWSPTHYHLVIGVPILPGVGTLAEGATGAYDQYFTALGQTLVSDNEADAILRLGWEFNGNWFRWSVATSADAANFVSFWRQIVTTMRVVPGAHFKFLWNPNAPSPTTYSPDQAYPGNAYVDYVGTDVYDNFWGSPFTPSAAWRHQLIQQWGLNWLGAFAAEHDEPIAIPEWSDEYRPDGHGLGDDPAFVDDMAQWFVNNQVAFADVFAYDSSSTYRNNLLDGTFPKALARFKEDFG